MTNLDSILKTRDIKCLPAMQETQVQFLGWEDPPGEYSLEGLMPKLNLQNFGHLRQRADSLEKTLMLGKIEGRRRGQQRTRWLDSITDSTNMSLSKPREM